MSSERSLTANGATVVAASGPVVRARIPGSVMVGEVARVGPRRLLSEVIHVDGEVGTLQVYEETQGLRVGDSVELTGAPLVAWLGPGMLGRVYDGLQRPLDTLASAGTWLLLPGSSRDDTPIARAAGVDTEPAFDALGAARWEFRASAAPGAKVGPGDILGELTEGGLRHRVTVPPDVGPGRVGELEGGSYSVRDQIGSLDGPRGPVPLYLAHPWPLRSGRPAARRLPIHRPLVTGQRVIDMLYPIALGGTAIVPGAFGTGKTVVEQQLARWSDADVVVYVGCGERGNEMAELLSTFPELQDPRTGAPLLERTVLIANTSNMPVAAREASVQLGMTEAEYYRDQGLHVALLADSTSRWAEALREISGRLEELPGEEGFPAYLGSRLASFYERTGQVESLGDPARTGSVTLVAAVSPPGGDFSEPVTQASLRLAGTFWALDAELAHARHFPAIGWDRSYSLYVDALASWYDETLGLAWSDLRASALELLAREKELLDIVALVGADALPDHDRALLEVARLLRETFLQQGAFDPVDSARPLDEQLALLDAVVAAQAHLERALDAGETLAAALESETIAELRRAKELSGPDVVAQLAALAARLRDGSSEPSGESAGASEDGEPTEPAPDPAPGAESGTPAPADEAVAVGEAGSTDAGTLPQPPEASGRATVTTALSAHRLTGADRLVGPLLVLRRTPRMALGEDVTVRAGGGAVRHGQIAELGEDIAVIQVYEGTSGLALESVSIELSGDTFRLGVSSAMLGRVLDGRGLPIDDGPPIVPLRLADVNGGAINPASRDHPEDFIETGISAIDLMASLVCGQKLPIFTGSGLPANELAARIATGARLLGEERFVTVFAAMGITRREADGFRDAFASSGVLDTIAVFLNLADDPAIERLLTPRCALTLAEHLGFELGFNVLVVMTDVLAYGEALRELSTAREEIPGRRGYPGYLYTDLATLFERAGRVRGRPGSVTVLPIVTLPDDDITHPIPDLTGYITEGQIVLSRELWGRSIAPPVDVLPCLSRVMNAGIGEGHTRAEHRVVADQLYALYARGRSLRQLVTVIGEAALSDAERGVLAFADAFEHRLVGQGRERRTLDESFDTAWAVLEALPDEELTRIPAGILARRRAAPSQPTAGEADEATEATEAAGPEPAP